MLVAIHVAATLVAIHAVATLVPTHVATHVQRATHAPTHAVASKSSFVTLSVHR